MLENFPFVHSRVGNSFCIYDCEFVLHYGYVCAADIKADYCNGFPRALKDLRSIAEDLYMKGGPFDNQYRKIIEAINRVVIEHNDLLVDIN